MRSHGGVSVRIAVTLVCSVLVACQGAIPIPAQGSPLHPDETFIPAGAPLPVLQSSLTSDPTADDSLKPAIAPPGGVSLRHSTSPITLRSPSPRPGARRVGMQVGACTIDEAP